MNSKRNSVRAAAAIVAGLIVSTALPAAGQYRQESGRALDANRRVGGSGANEPAGDRTGSRVTGNQIITGNVTGGREFRGPVGYRDPADFRGPLGTDLSDQFVRQSVGPARSYSPATELSGPQAFYGQARITPPPPGYVPTSGSTGGYVAVTSQDPTAIQTPWGSGRIGGSFNDTLTSRFSERVLPGPVGNAGEGSDTFISASPLYGVRLFKFDPMTGEPVVGQGDQDQSPLDRLGLTDRSIERMQEELNNVNNPRPRAPQESTNDKKGGSEDVKGNGPRPINEPLQGNIDNDPLSGNTANATPGTVNGGALSANARQRLLVAPSEQSETYRALEQMYERQNASRPPNDLEAAHQLQSLQTVQRNAADSAAAAKKPGANDAPPGTPRKPAAGGGGTTGTGTGNTGRTTPRVAPPAQGDPNAPGAKPVEPLDVDSLAAGVKAKGLADLLKSAEDLMKQAKFTSAITKYELAGRVAPNNALITLGRAHAELGASLYGQAENDIRRAIQTQPALLMGRYNLRTMIGEERLGFLVKDLKELSEKDPKQLRPLLLLSYIAYNTNNAGQASEYLDSALKLASADPVLQAMKEHWTLKKATETKPADGAAAPAPQVEKPAAPEKAPAPNLNK